MTIYNLGSINIDHIYLVPHLPGPGETLAATAHSAAPGGKGANQSVAAAKAGARVVHVGAVGPDGGAALAALAGAGVETGGIVTVSGPTGHARVLVDPAGENSIVIFPGANLAIPEDHVTAMLAQAAPGGLLLLQNETAHQALAARIGAERGLRVIYSAAPFGIEAVRAVLPHVSLLLLNAVEAAQLAGALGGLPPVECVVTRGAEGAEWISPGTDPLSVPAFPADPVDTTGAGDCFAGVLAASLAAGLDRAQSLRRAAAAAAIQVTRPGAAPAMPSAAEIDVRLAGRP